MADRRQGSNVANNLRKKRARGRGKGEDEEGMCRDDGGDRGDMERHSTR